MLARKWRPRQLQDVIGQSVTLRILHNILQAQRLDYVYLLSGMYGTGKTTLARILAKCVNCAAGVTPTPCDQCAACHAIDQGKCLDFYEIDAATRTKVEDIRDLLDHVPYPPAQVRYKVYLIDEAHMLSTHSFNALLKTLEEPPAHTIFILATTNATTLPATILSRCLQFHLQRLQITDITQRLAHICAAEQVDYDLPALTVLAEKAKGSLRDALSLLDQAMALQVKKISLHDVQLMLGSVNRDDLLPIFHALAAQQADTLFASIARLAEQAFDFEAAIVECIHFFHQLAIAQALSAPISDHTITLFLSLFTPETIQLCYQICLLSRRDLALAPTPRLGFEMMMLRMLIFCAAEDQETPHTNQLTPTVNLPQQQTAAHTTHAHPATQAISPTQWGDIVIQLPLTGAAKALAMHCAIKTASAQQITLLLAQQHAPLLHDKTSDRIQTALCEHFGRPLKLTIELTATPLPSTPATQAANQPSKPLSSVATQTLQHPQIKKLIDLYDATIEVSLIE